ncbi:hypothetical protein K488DRAFT_86838 [Vararia minispora EC-137]|uniref:Uncharacterized protein n=1 Tax=Vararia minispora EC-137 TaxID=1314806 RepID=A0ACB8QHX4_9AGAM|nr:hypothetical protein K488DRAFT_86838 [Vararia minispora EC-137]
MHLCRAVGRYLARSPIWSHPRYEHNRPSSLLQRETSGFQTQVWKASAAERAPAPELYNAFRDFRNGLDSLPRRERLEFISQARNTLQPDIRDAIRLLALSAIDPHYLKSVYFHFSVKHPLVDRNEALSIILHALAELNDVLGMYRWLTRHASSIRLKHWDIYLRHIVIDRRHQSKLAPALNAMPGTGCLPTTETFLSILRTIFQLPFGAVPRAVDALKIIRTRQSSHDRDIRALVVAEAAKIRTPHEAARLLAAYPAGVTFREKDDPHVRHAVRISDAFHNSGRTHGVQIFQECHREGFRPSPDSLAIILQDNYTPSDIVFWQNTLNVRAEPFVWANLIRRTAARRDGNRAVLLTTFDHARTTGIDPSFTVAESLVSNLCAGELEEPLEEDIRRAYDICLDVYNWYSSDLGEGRGGNTWDPVLPPGQEAIAAQRVYNVLFHTMARAQNWELYYSWARRLVEHLCALRMTISSDTLAHYTSLLVQNAPTLIEARKSYLLSRTFQEPKLTVADCTVILRALLSREDDDSGLPPWREYLFVMKRMLSDGVALTASTYNELLSVITSAGERLRAKLGTAPENTTLLQHLSTHVHAAHTIQHTMALNAGVCVSTECQNQLMAAFSTLGSVDDALRIWENIIKPDTASVRIALEACAVGARACTAVKIVQAARRRLFNCPLDRACWQALLECLCRAGDIDGAARLLCMQMGRENEPEPDVVAARMVLTYAHAEGLAVPTAERIKQFLPHVYAQIPQEFLNSLIGPSPTATAGDERVPASATLHDDSTSEISRPNQHSQPTPVFRVAALEKL